MANYFAPRINQTFLIPGTNTPASGGQLFCYANGTSTKQTAYQGPTTSTPWSNPIILDSGGNIPSGSKQIWFPGGQTFTAIFAPSNDTDPPASPYNTWNDLVGENDPSGISASSEWVAGTAATFISATSFSVVGDQTTLYTKGRRIKAVTTGGTVYATITNVAFSTLTTVTVSGGALDSGISSGGVSYALFDPANPSISFYEVTRQSVTSVPAATTTNIWATDGDSVHITGSTTIASFGPAPYAGATKKVIFDNNPAITHNISTLVVPPSLGSATFTTVASTFATIYAESLTKNLLVAVPFAKRSRQVFTTSSGTYTPLPGLIAINVRAIGGGGGGGAANTNAGKTGTTTTFGSLTASGGTGGTASGTTGVAGGAASGGDINIPGGGGGGGDSSGAASNGPQGGQGGCTPLGGGGYGGGGSGQAGGAGSTNSGGGGGGAGQSGTVSGGGGGGGGYVEALITNLATTFPYVVGPGGTAGAAGGTAGGDGATGIIIVDEFRS